MLTPDPPASGRLNPSECWQLLRTTDLGRLAVVSDDGGPDIFPVNHVVDHGSVLLRTAAGTKLLAALTGPAVAFEADGRDQQDRSAWSVVVRGHAEEVTDLDELLAVDDAGLEPWHEAPKPRFLRIIAQQISGRRLVAAAPGTWTSPLTGLSRRARE